MVLRARAGQGHTPGGMAGAEGREGRSGGVLDPRGEGWWGEESTHGGWSREGALDLWEYGEN